VHDATAGFRAFRADFVAGLDLDAIRADGYGFQIEMTYQTRLAGGTIVEVPIHFGERHHGVSKMSGRIIGEALALVTWWAIRDRVLRVRRA
jgi:dolichol-phosphate mannosyltransferase